MTFNNKLVDKILEAIFPLPEEFGVILQDDEEIEPVDFSYVQEAVVDADPDADVYFGMSKLVICSPHLGGIVIKIPFNGFYYVDEETGELIWNDFTWATGSDNSDYCLTEFEKYKRLRTYGLDCFVAKTFFYKVKSGVRVFIQEEVSSMNDLYQTRKPSQKSSDLVKKWREEGKVHMDSEWVANCLDKYGKSKVERFLYYCANIDPDILEDMHDGNFGYRGDETPCILDYSNYGD